MISTHNILTLFNKSHLNRSFKVISIGLNHTHTNIYIIHFHINTYLTKI